MGEGQTQSPKDSVPIRHRDLNRPHRSSSLRASTSATPVPTYPAAPEKLVVQKHTNFTPSLWCWPRSLGNTQF